NTLTADDAVLLAMLSDNVLDPEAARRVIAARPAQGWDDLHDFFAMDAIRAAGLGDDAMQQLRLATRYFSLHTEVEYDGAEVLLSALLDSDPHRSVRLRAEERRVGQAGGQ